MDSSVQCYKCNDPLEDSAQVGVCAKCLAELGNALCLGVLPRVTMGDRPMPRPPPRLDDYELLDEIARGAMGIVYRARHLSLDRSVALKVIRFEGTSVEAAQRFHFETRAAAKLDHPNIVPVYDSGEVDGHYFYSMKLIQGRSLAEALGQPGSPPLPRACADRFDSAWDQWAVRLMDQVARAVHYAHQHGVIHRDLKPSNILLDMNGEPHVTDFGLAKLLDLDISLTLSEAVIGSPKYMAPEQASGRSREATTATDVYSMGAVFYELLTGKPPFQGTQVVETLRLVVEADPLSPSRLRPGLDPELEIICLKCLEKEPFLRYGSAQALAEDLERWQRHEPILARPATFGTRVGKWIRRNPMTAALVVALHVVAAAGLIGIFWQWRQVRQHAFELAIHLYSSDMVRAGLALQQNDLHTARQLLDRHRPEPGAPDLRGWEWRVLAGQCLGQESFTLGSHNQQVTVGFASSQQLVSLTRDGHLQIWDVASRLPVASAQLEGSLFLEEVSPDGRWFAVANEDSKQAGIWSIETLRRIGTIPVAQDSSHHLLTFAPDGESAFAVQEKSDGSQDHRVVRVSLGTETLTFEPIWEAPGILDLLCSPDGERLAVMSKGLNQVILSDLDQGIHTVIRDTTGEPLPAGKLSFSPNGRKLIVTNDRAIHFVDVRTASVVESRPHPIAGITHARLTPDGRHLYANLGQRLWLQQLDPWRTAALYRGHTENIGNVAASPDGRWLVTGSHDGTIKFWDTQPGATADTIATLFNQPGLSRFDENCGRLVTITGTPAASEIIVRTTQDWRETARLSISGDAVVDALTIGSDNLLAVMRADERVELWATETQNLQTSLLPAASQAFNDWGIAVARLRTFDQGKRLLALQALFGTITWLNSERRVALEIYHFDTTTWQVLDQCSFKFSFGLTSLEFSPDGRQFLVGGHDGEIVLCDLKTGSQLKALAGHKGTIREMAFSSDGRLLATTSSDGYLALWDTTSWTLKSMVRAHPHSIFTVAFHPQGDSVIAGGMAGAPLGIWIVDSLRELGSFPLPQRTNVNRLLFLDSDTLLAWTGHWVPSRSDVVQVLRVPELANLTSWQP